MLSVQNRSVIMSEEKTSAWFKKYIKTHFIRFEAFNIRVDGATQFCNFAKNKRCYGHWESARPLDSVEGISSRHDGHSGI